MSEHQQCAVPGCPRAAEVEVILYDVYLGEGVFFKRDFTCPFLCTEHMTDNELLARGLREPHGGMFYPFTNRHQAAGFTIYRPLPEHEEEPTRASRRHRRPAGEGTFTRRRPREGRRDRF